MATSSIAMMLRPNRQLTCTGTNWTCSETVIPAQAGNPDEKRELCVLAPAFAGGRQILHCLAYFTLCSSTAVRRLASSLALEKLPPLRNAREE